MTFCADNHGVNLFFLSRCWVICVNENLDFETAIQAQASFLGSNWLRTIFVRYLHLQLQKLCKKEQRLMNLEFWWIYWLLFNNIVLSMQPGIDQLVDLFWSSGGSRGGKSGHGPPHRSWQWSLAPLGGRKSNESIVNLPKSKDFGPPISLSATELAPLRKSTTKH